MNEEHFFFKLKKNFLYITLRMNYFFKLKKLFFDRIAMHKFVFFKTFILNQRNLLSGYTIKYIRYLSHSWISRYWSRISIFLRFPSKKQMQNFTSVHSAQFFNLFLCRFTVSWLHYAQILLCTIFLQTNCAKFTFKIIISKILPSIFLYKLHRSTKYEVVIVIEIPIVISEVIFGVETESGLRIAPSRQIFE